jgi:hypothetical protein
VAKLLPERQLFSSETPEKGAEREKQGGGRMKKKKREKRERGGEGERSYGIIMAEKFGISGKRSYIYVFLVFRGIIPDFR